jgi:hypothetical protein
MTGRKQQREAERQAVWAEWSRAEIPLLEDLKSVGVNVDSVWKLIQEPYPRATVLPILLKHIQQSYPDAVREGIARAAAVPEFEFGWDVLTRLYRKEPDGRFKEGLAVAIRAVSQPRNLEEIIAMVNDPVNGPSRILLLQVLERTPDPRGRATFERRTAGSSLREARDLNGTRRRHG